MKRTLFILAALLTSATSFSQSIDLKQMLADGKLVSGLSSEIKSFEEGNKKGINCRDNVWLKDIDLSYGTIEVDIRGRNEFLKSFPGIAFYAVDTSRNYDVIYFRPFNFRHADPVRRIWSVQYMSLPQYGYDRLRKENTGQFESEIIPNPKPEDWIQDLDPGLKQGSVGYWFGNSSSCAYKNLTVKTY
jgi:hypothetical protein